MAQSSSAYNLGKAFGANGSSKVEMLSDIRNTGVARVSGHSPFPSTQRRPDLSLHLTEPAEVGRSASHDRQRRRSTKKNM